MPVEEAPVQSLTHTEKVVLTYEVMDAFREASGIAELTEGLHGTDTGSPLSYECAHTRMRTRLATLGQVSSGCKVLDIGCGNGALMQTCICMGAKATGITLSEKQRQYNDDHERNVLLLNWRDIRLEFPYWKGWFDCVFAIGSLEHYVSPREAAGGLQEFVYHRFFETCRWLLKPCGRLVVTAIHYRKDETPPPQSSKPMVLRPWNWRSPTFHHGTLMHFGGAYYPLEGLLERIAVQYGFELQGSVEDGTNDYRETSEHWLRSARAVMHDRERRKIILRRIRQLGLDGVQVLLALLIFQSWNWQFRDRGDGNGAPTKLLRFVWERDSS